MKSTITKNKSLSCPYLSYLFHFHLLSIYNYLKHKSPNPLSYHSEDLRQFRVDLKLLFSNQLISANILPSYILQTMTIYAAELKGKKSKEVY
jgi:hypothetical protein